MFLRKKLAPSNISIAPFLTNQMSNFNIATNYIVFFDETAFISVDGALI